MVLNHESSGAVHDFALYQCRGKMLQQDNFHDKCNVTVDNHLYRDVFVSTYYQVPYMDYKVEIVWEDDPSQPDYKELGLHGSYSSNFQDFVFNETGNFLSFTDGDHNISIYPDLT